MKITKNRVTYAAFVTALCGSILSLGPHPTSVAMEFAIFDWKLGMVLFAVSLCIKEES